MKAIQIYEATDGARFDSVEKCRDHEHLLVALSEAMWPIGQGDDMPRQYAPLTDAELEWFRRYVARNEDRQRGEHYGRWLATIDERDAEIRRLMEMKETT